MDAQRSAAVSRFGQRLVRGRGRIFRVAGAGLDENKQRRDSEAYETCFRSRAFLWRGTSFRDGPGDQTPDAIAHRGISRSRFDASHRPGMTTGHNHFTGAHIRRSSPPALPATLASCAGAAVAESIFLLAEATRAVSFLCALRTCRTSAIVRAGNRARSPTRMTTTGSRPGCER